MGRKLSAFLSQLYWLLGDLSERNKQEVKDFLLDFASNEPQAKSRIERFPDDGCAMASCCPHRKQIKLSDMAKHGWEGGGAVAKLARDISSPQQEPLDIDPKRMSKLGRSFFVAFSAETRFANARKFVATKGGGL